MWKSRRPTGKTRVESSPIERRGGLAALAVLHRGHHVVGLVQHDVDLLFLDGNERAAVEAHFLRGRVPQRAGVQDRNAAHGDAAVADHLVGHAAGDGRGQGEVPVQALSVPIHK